MLGWNSELLVWSGLGFGLDYFRSGDAVLALCDFIVGNISDCTALSEFWSGVR
jgi:hypothetical protein